MEKYRLSLRALLRELVGKEDVCEVDFHEIDSTTQKSDLDFKKVVGAVRLQKPDLVQLPSDSEITVKSFLEATIP